MIDAIKNKLKLLFIINTLSDKHIIIMSHLCLQTLKKITKNVPHAT